MPSDSSDRELDVAPDVTAVAISGKCKPPGACVSAFGHSWSDHGRNNSAPRDLARPMPASPLPSFESCMAAVSGAHSPALTRSVPYRAETVEHPFGTLKARMGATHFLMKRLPRVATEMALHVLAYNLTRVINIMGPGPLIAVIKT
jgi:hypothetical protein